MSSQNENLERLLDLIAEHLITSDLPNMSARVSQAQKFIRDGKISQGSENGAGVLALFQKDIKANQEDLNNLTTINPGQENEEIIPTLQNIANTVVFDTLEVSSSIGNNDISIFLKGGGENFPAGGEPITDLIIGDGNPLNVSQVLKLDKLKTNIDIQQAEEYLDTNIFELLPSGDTRQARIIRFFQELNTLLPPLPGQQGQPPFDFEDDDDGMVNRDNQGNWVSSSLYDKNTSISYAQDNPFLSNTTEENAFFHRLKTTANSTNNSRTIEDIYRRVLPYLTDILEEEIELQDDRPVYQNKSSGYLKFRNLNQGIIIRNTNQEFVKGLNPNNPTYLNTDGTGGFTITMWIRFLDKVSEGTLFNFGNLTRAENPFGFKLETFVLNKDERTYYTSDDGQQGEAQDGDANYTWGSKVESNTQLSNQGIFSNSNTARFVRLLVREDIGESGVRDSHLGNTGARKFSWDYPETSYRDGILTSVNLRLLNETFIPENFNEWYFICASYNPNIIEPNDTDIESDVYQAYDTNKDFWLNHILPNTTGDVANTPHEYTNFSNFGNKCKVEIISKTDLLRARGFKVN